MTRQILYQTYVASQGTRTYDVRATMDFDETRLSDDEAREIYIQFLKDLINDREKLIVVNKQSEVN